jgi:hypothetical protein
MTQTLPRGFSGAIEHNMMRDLSGQPLSFYIRRYQCSEVDPSKKLSQTAESEESDESDEGEKNKDSLEGNMVEVKCRDSNLGLVAIS